MLRTYRRDLRTVDKQGNPQGAVWDICFIQIAAGVWIAVSWTMVNEI
jgi:hypothetical protein